MSATKFMSGGAAAVGGVVIDNGLFDWSKFLHLKHGTINLAQMLWLLESEKKSFVI